MRSFLADQSDDLSATMATLDKQLRRAEGLLARLKPRHRQPAAEAAGDEPPPTAAPETVQPL
jgi:hypothetical protein